MSPAWDLGSCLIPKFAQRTKPPQLVAEFLLLSAARFPQVTHQVALSVPLGALCAWWCPPCAGCFPRALHRPTPRRLCPGPGWEGPRSHTACLTGALAGWPPQSRTRPGTALSPGNLVGTASGDPSPRLVMQELWRRGRACLWFGCVLKPEDHCLSAWPVAGRAGGLRPDRAVGSCLSVCCGSRATTLVPSTSALVPHQPAPCSGPPATLSCPPDAHGASLRSSCTS